MIPKKIHYCWFGNNPLPKGVRKCIESWKKYAPDFEIIEWNEQNFDIQSNQFAKSAYEAKAWAFVSDYVRLKVIYEYGGIYLDTDVELLKPISELLNNDFYIGRQQDGFPTTGLGFGAKKNHFITKRLLEEYSGLKYEEEKKYSISCPRLNSRVIYAIGYTDSSEIWYKDQIAVYGPKYFDPIAQGDTKNLLCDDSYSIHHYAGSWTSAANVLKRKICRMIGEVNIYKIKKMIRWLRRK